MMKLLALALFGVTALFPALTEATTCSQANSECEAKALENIIVGPQDTGASQAKGLINIITGANNEAAVKLLVNVIVIPGTGTVDVVPMSPLTGFR